jgi:hypothetical protein
VSQKIQFYVQVGRENCRTDQYGCLKPIEKALNLEIYLLTYTNNWKVLKCGVGGGWKRSVGLIM